tara:strand:- start:123 stop:299 length:177 start_codon:yes stop_codon:yes gene_type:complete
MKITLTKKVTLPHGKKVDKGLTLEVVNEYGRELIEAGKAVEFGEDAPVIIEEQTNNLN